MSAVKQLALTTGIQSACDALAFPRSSFYRLQYPVHGPRNRRPSPARCLAPAEHNAVLAVLH
jgi:hypothetical protein